MPAVCFRTTDSPRNTLPRPSPRKTPMKRTAQTANGTTGSRNNRKSVAAPRQTDDGDEQATPRASTFDVRGKDGAGDDAHSNVVESEPTSMTSSLVIEGDNFNNAAQSFTEPLTSQSTLPRTLERLSKAKRVRFYRNGDQYYKGQWYPLSDRMKSMKPLMEDLTKTMCDSVALPHGIRHIFTIDGANRITDIDQFEDGESYVCSSSDVFKSLDYANAREPFWCLATTSNRGGRFGQTDNGPAPLNVSAEPSNEPRDFVYPRIITVIRNGNKPRRVVRHLLNKKTARSFDQVLTDLTSIVKLDSGAIRKLYGLSGKQATTLRDFFEEDHIFIAYGNEKSTADDFLVVSEEHKRLYTRSGNRGNLALGNRSLPARNESLREDRSGSVIPDEMARRLPLDLEGRFEIKRLLGDGNTALVYEVLDREQVERRALKIIAKENVVGKQELIDCELSVMSRVEHPFIVKMYDYWMFDGSYYMSLELITGGDLFEHLYKVRKLNERQSARLIRCLADSLCYLHDNGILHRDIKPENLLLYPYNETEFELKLADFGLACELPADETQLTTICGTPTYVAPEVLLETGYDEKVDTWAVGVILYVMLCGFPPFQALDGNQTELFTQILAGHFNFPSPSWDNTSASVRALILCLVDIDRDTRLTARQLFENVWVQNLADVSSENEMMAQLAIDTKIGAYNRMEETEGEYLYYSRRTSMDELSECGHGGSQDGEFVFRRSYS